MNIENSGERTNEQTPTLIETASKFTFTFWDNVVWLNSSEPGLTVLEDIDI
jgi:hypothetical protein